MGPMYEQPSTLPLSRFRLHSDDPALRVRWLGGSRFSLSGEVEADPEAELEVATPSADVEVALARRSTPAHAVAQLRRALPRSVSLRHATVHDGVELTFLEALVPAASPPRFRLFSSDPGVQVRQLDDNKLEFLSGPQGTCLVTILCDSRRVTLSIPAATSALGLAARVGASVPHGYRALVEGPVVSVWKDADFFSAVA